MLVSLAALAALLASVSAQGVGSLSTGCTIAASQLLLGPLATCLNVTGLTNIIAGDPSASIVPPLQDYVSTLCVSTPCNTADVTSTNTSLQQGCASDVQAGNGLAIALTSVISNFNSSIASFCAREISNGTYCLPQVLEGIQNATLTNFTAESLQAFVGASNSSIFSSVPSSVLCTDCGLAIFTEIDNILSTGNQTLGAEVNQTTATTCNVTVAVPSGITTAQGSASASAAARRLRRQLFN